MNDVHSTATVRRSAEINELATALAKAQGDYQIVEKKRKARVKGKTRDGNPYDYTFQYADLGDVLGMALPILSKQGIAFTQPTVVEGGVIYIRTTLMHSSGQWQESDYPVASFGDKKHQQMGEALTFAKRYAGCAALGIAPEETIEGDTDIGGDTEVGRPVSPPRKPEREPPQVISASSQSKALPPMVGKGDGAGKEHGDLIPVSVDEDGKPDWLKWVEVFTERYKASQDRRDFKELHDSTLNNLRHDDPELFDRLVASTKKG